LKALYLITPTKGQFEEDGRLKELWTFKWSRSFNIAGPWTKAGGCDPADRPDWMRGYKDY